MSLSTIARELGVDESRLEELVRSARGSEPVDNAPSVSAGPEPDADPVPNPAPADRPARVGPCWNCGRMGHIKAQCPDRPPEGGKGHRSAQRYHPYGGKGKGRGKGQPKPQVYVNVQIGR
jgi:hypothetical protein